MDSHIDRESNVKKLHEIFPQAITTPAIIPTWEEDMGIRSVLGCTLSHLSILRGNNSSSVLILEDDAEIRPEYINYFDHLTIPKDAAVIIFGGEIPKSSTVETEYNNYNSVTGVYYGSHAVWYNLNILKDSNFFETALKLIETSQIGTHTERDTPIVGLCYESVLSFSLHHNKLKCYRPRNIPFTTISAVSSRTDKIMHPRNLYLDI
jgi:hypothetical protein